MRGVPFQESCLGKIEFFWKKRGGVTRNRAIPSCFNNLVTSRIFDPEFLKSKKLGKKKGMGISV